MEFVYIVIRRARFRWGDHLGFVSEASPGDLVRVPPYVSHHQINARTHIPLEAVLVPSGQELIVVDLDIPSPESDPGNWRADPFHS
jgi:uncharacterized RmlC-like cupin family protein